MSLRTEVYERMDGRTTVKSIQKLCELAELPFKELEEEGFEANEILEFFKIKMSEWFETDLS